ncbi:unnamed protein product [Moneuplotes crassus]|uniref:Uncharacterized protein n=1 Tax=Euplotes crassus TaxID=5936 RepID=A0AAD1U8Z1_EUPCR|nr:unnamed protein product [Moneuplotes crassus]
MYCSSTPWELINIYTAPTLPQAQYQNSYSVNAHCANPNEIFAKGEIGEKSQSKSNYSVWNIPEISYIKIPVSKDQEFNCNNSQHTSLNQKLIQGDFQNSKSTSLPTIKLSYISKLIGVMLLVCLMVTCIINLATLGDSVDEDLNGKAAIFYKISEPKSIGEMSAFDVRVKSSLGQSELSQHQTLVMNIDKPNTDSTKSFKGNEESSSEENNTGIFEVGFSIIANKLDELASSLTRGRPLTPPDTLDNEVFSEEVKAPLRVLYETFDDETKYIFRDEIYPYDGLPSVLEVKDVYSDSDTDNMEYPKHCDIDEVELERDYMNRESSSPWILKY